MTAIAGPERAWHLRLLAVAVIGLWRFTGWAALKATF